MPKGQHYHRSHEYLIKVSNECVDEDSEDTGKMVLDSLCLKKTKITKVIQVYAGWINHRFFGYTKTYPLFSLPQISFRQTFTHAYSKMLFACYCSGLDLDYNLISSIP